MKNKTINTSTSTTSIATLPTIEEIEKIYSELEPHNIITKIEMTSAFFSKIKRETKESEIVTAWAIPVIVNDKLKLPFKIFYKKIK